MRFIDDVEILATSSETLKASKSFTENLLKALTGNVFAAKDAMKEVISVGLNTKEIIFWHKYVMYLNGVFSDDYNIRKMSEMFSDNNESKEFAMRIIKIIDDIDTEKKVEYIINLTRALLAGFLDKPDYYRLCYAVRNTMQEDLIFISENIKKERLKNNMQIEFLKYNGFVVCVESYGDGINDLYDFTILAKKLDKYGISYNIDGKHDYRDKEQVILQESLQIKNMTTDGGTF